MGILRAESPTSLANEVATIEKGFVMWGGALHCSFMAALTIRGYGVASSLDRSQKYNFLKVVSFYALIFMVHSLKRDWNELSSE